MTIQHVELSIMCYEQIIKEDLETKSTRRILLCCSFTCNKICVTDSKGSKTSGLESGDLCWHHLPVHVPYEINYTHLFALCMLLFYHLYIIRQSTFSNKSCHLLNQGWTQCNAARPQEFYSRKVKFSGLHHLPTSTGTIHHLGIPEKKQKFSTFNFFPRYQTDHSAIFCFLPLTCTFNQLLNVLTPQFLLSSLASTIHSVITIKLA